MTGPTAFYTATIVLMAVYALIISEKVNRAVAALLGGAILVIAGVLNQDEAIRAIDFNTIGFLAGMMIVVGVARTSGLFEYLAIKAAQSARGNPAGILVSLSLITAILSAGLDNVTTVLLVVPVTMGICRHLRVPPYPFLFAEIFASNIGGAATEIGDPPNILIGSTTHLSFNDFLIHMAPVAVVVLIVQLGINHLIWGRRLKARPADKAAVMALCASKEIRDRRMFTISVVMLIAIIAAFAVGEMFHLHAGTIALFGAAVMLLLHNLPYKAHRQNENIVGVLKDVEWVTIFFFIGLFIVIGAVEKTGLITMLASALTHATGGDMKLTATGVLWLSALASAIIDNIPFVATMIPLLKDMAPTFGGVTHMEPVWWSLAFGACLGGNGTLIGASANLVVAGEAEKAGVNFRFRTFTLMALPMMLLSIAICQLYILWRYF